jgi:hypothetical protein
LPPSLAELEQQSASLRALHRRCQDKLRELEQAEAELCQERRAFESICAEQRAYLELAARQLEERHRTVSEVVPPPVPEQGSGLCAPLARDTVQDNVPRCVYVERDEAREQAARAQEEVARLQRELEHSQLLLRQREAELTAVQAEATLSRATAQASSHQDHLANLRRIREQLAQQCPADALPC